jgi:hypothetical protein
VRLGSVHQIKRWVLEVFPPILVFLAIDAGLTVLFFQTSAPSVHIGTLRPVYSIPPKLLELASVGAGLGLIASLMQRRIDLGIIALSAAFTSLLDLDHLPSALGIAQPIRPAHSIAFACLAVLILWITFRKRPEVPLIFIAAFLGHIAADTGVFAILAPFTFHYYSLDALKIPIAVCAVAFAAFAGYAKPRRQVVISKLTVKA